jgi:hypothetical protein
MEIANPKTAEFVPLLGAFNFERKPMGALGIPDEFSFLMDWTKGGEGQEVLREHIRDGPSFEWSNTVSNIKVCSGSRVGWTAMMAWL